MSNSAVSATPEPVPSKSFVARLVGVFFSPGETFADVARRPDFIIPLLIMVVLWRELKLSWQESGWSRSSAGL